MNTQEIKQRLIEAALTDDIPQTPAFEIPHSPQHHRMPKWVEYAAAACGAVLISLPIWLYRPAPTDLAESTATIEETEADLEGAFTMISQHLSTSENNLMDLVQ